MANASTDADREIPFAAFAGEVRMQDMLRAAITAATRRAESACLPPLLDLAAATPEEAERTAALARTLVLGLRGATRGGGVEGLIHEYSLSSQEGVALMCLAEALLRIPDAATRDALIRDKIAGGDWRAHVGQSPSLFVNAATWGLVVTGRLVGTVNETGLSAALQKLIARGGEPLIRRGVDLAMRMMGEQFVAGETIADALRHAKRMEAKGFTYSYDMLGEAATTAADAARYLADYQGAIHAIGRAAAGRGVVEGPGISIKLSALHPRYSRAKRGRVMAELLPRLKGLALLARSYAIGLNIDAEEADRLELSLDMLEALAFDPDLAGWDGIGFVLQAYGKRCPFAVDWIVDLARRSGHRLMIRLVKGAYWDSEIKRAQVDGLGDFPVFTRKVHTDVSYLACAKKLLDASDAVFPQFATHNAQTLAAIHTMAGPDFWRGQYEFQCLHGMGEPLYERVVGSNRLNRPCRIYAPVGTHETLLAYLVRRLLENGANSSFVNRIADEAVSVETLVADPVAAVRASVPVGAPHHGIALPRNLYGSARANARGLDLADEDGLSGLAAALITSATQNWRAGPTLSPSEGLFVPVRSPADHQDIVGSVRDADAEDVERALAAGAAAAAEWAGTPAASRAAPLRRAADMMEAAMPTLIGLLVREAGKSFANAVAEVREAVDFLRYYAGEAERTLSAGAEPLGPVACISPWNFPLAIFTGQVAAALAAGNPVLAKPAEETPLVAAEAVRLLHAAGVPRDALQLVPGEGSVGAALVADARVQGVLFTGSTEVARLIQRQLAGRLTRAGHPVPLIAEPGGQNVLIADSSALAEQVVADVLASAFDSAGQRCSALRILCLQEEAAERVLAMLKGAMQELEVGRPNRLSVDVGPVISEAARAGIEAHVAAMGARGHLVTRLPLSEETLRGTFVAPTIIEVDRIADVESEVFGPVLHVLRYRRADLDALLDAINATGYGLTFGLHTRLDETIARVTERVRAGNVYVNRNMVGAVVGVQPFGGSGLSGTGPKAGGPLYLRRLLAKAPPLEVRSPNSYTAPLACRYVAWLRGCGRDTEAAACSAAIAASALGTTVELAGPVGERNIYTLRPRGRIAAVASSESGLLVQVGVILATGNQAVVDDDHLHRAALAGLPSELATQVHQHPIATALDLSCVLFEGAAEALVDLMGMLAARPGPILTIHARSPSGPAASLGYDLERLLEERTVSTNTTAAGGNASLMSLREHA